MTFVALGRVVRLVTEKAAGQPFRIGLEAIESQTGRLVGDPVTDYAGDGTTFERGDVLFGKLRPYLAKVWMAETRGAAVGDFHVYRPDPAKLVGQYLRYCLLAGTFLDPVASSVFGAKMPRASWDFIRNVEVFLPAIHEQRVIADYLDRETAQIDTLIEQQRRLIQLQHERRQAVIDVGVFGLEQGTSGRMHITIGQHRAVEPLLARIPENWRVLRFKAVLNRLDQRNIDLSQPMMSLKSSGEVVPRSSLGERQEPDAVSLPKYLVVHVGDLVVNPMWLIGGAIGVTDVDGAVSPDYRVFQSGGRHHPRYLHHLLRSRPYINQYLLYTRAQTTFDRRIQQADLNNLPMPVPPMGEQSTIAARIDEQAAKIDVLIASTERFIELARERRSALITAAVTGQIDVRGEVA